MRAGLGWAKGSVNLLQRGVRLSGMVLTITAARRGGALLVVGRRSLLVARPSATAAGSVSVVARQFSSNMPPKPPSASSKERAEFKEATLPVDNIKFNKTGFLETVDRLANIMFMAEIFRALWLSAEVKRKQLLEHSWGEQTALVPFLSHVQTQSHWVPTGGVVSYRCSAVSCVQNVSIHRIACV